jgi:hypothetical protein
MHHFALSGASLLLQLLPPLLPQLLPLPQLQHEQRVLFSVIRLSAFHPPPWSLLLPHYYYTVGVPFIFRHNIISIRV